VKVGWLSAGVSGNWQMAIAHVRMQLKDGAAGRGFAQTGKNPMYQASPGR